MILPRYSSQQRPRELRRRVVIPARLRVGAQWSDACILNVSSRGLMVHSGNAGPKDSLVELRRGEHVIIARVVWRDGGRVGLRCDNRLPVEEIMSVSQSQSLRLVASDGALIGDRAKDRQSALDPALRRRAVEFMGVAAIALCLAIGVWAMVEQVLPGPLAEIDAALAS
ncbi:MAG: PilZ domain-containing protein [Sphingomicrobium sp.]